MKLKLKHADSTILLKAGFVWTSVEDSIWRPVFNSVYSTVYYRFRDMAYRLVDVSVESSIKAQSET